MNTVSWYFKPELLQLILILPTLLSHKHPYTHKTETGKVVLTSFISLIISLLRPLNKIASLLVSFNLIIKILI